MSVASAAAEYAGNLAPSDEGGSASEAGSTAGRRRRSQASSSEDSSDSSAPPSSNATAGKEAQMPHALGGQGTEQSPDLTAGNTQRPTGLVDAPNADRSYTLQGELTLS